MGTSLYLAIRLVVAEENLIHNHFENSGTTTLSQNKNTENLHYKWDLTR